MADFDAVTHKDVESSRRRAFNTLNQKVDASLLNPRVGWTDPAQGGASGTRAPFDPAAQYELGGGGGSLTIDGDLDMKSYDIINLDRMFFLSDNGLDISNTKGHITSNATGLDLVHFTPSTGTHKFHVGSSTVNLEVARTKINAGKDIDMQTHDIRDLDRLYFKPNSALLTSSSRTYITSNVKSLGGDELFLFVPTNKIQHFYGGALQLLSLSSVSARFQTPIECTKRIVADDEIKVGDVEGTPTDGSIWYADNKLKARINGETVNLGGTPLVAPTAAAGAFWVPVKTYPDNTQITAVTAATLDELFGAQKGAIGVLRPQTTAAAQASTTYLMFKGRYSGASSKWFGVAFNGAFYVDPTTTGIRDTNLEYSSQTAPYGSHTDSDPHNRVFPSRADQKRGRWGVYYESDEWNDAAILVYTISSTTSTDGVLYWKDANLEGGSAKSSVTSGSDTPTLANTIKVIEGSAHTAAGLDAAFGVDDGCMGAYLGTQNYIYVKVNGYWFYINLATRGLSG